MENLELLINTIVEAIDDKKVISAASGQHYITIFSLRKMAVK